MTRAEKLRNLIRLIPAPDFPTAGQIVGRQGAVQAYMTGRGSIMMRAKSEVETNKKGDRQAIIVTEIPYQVNKAKLIERIAELVREKTIEGISDLRDESDREGMRIVIELKHHHARDCRGATEGVEPSGARRQLRRVPPRCRSTAHRVRAEEGRSPP